MLGLIQKLGRFLLYGGFGGPKAYETKILEMTVAALSEPDAQSLARQIGLIERMQRWNEDRMVIVGFEDKALLPKLRNESEAHCLAKFRLKGEFGSVTAAVMAHRGVFSSLEFRPSPTKIKGHDFAVELVALPAGGRAEGLCPAAGGELVDETVRMRRLIEGSPFRRDRRHRQTAFVERLRFNSRNLLMYLAVPA